MFFIKPLICLLISLYLFSCLEIQAQHTVSDDVGDISSVDILQLPPLDNQNLRKSNQNINKNTFAEARSINVSPKSNGTWESTKSGTSVWRQRIKSPNAYSLNLGFTKFKLEKNVSLFIYNEDKSEIFGPFTEKDNDDHLQLWTPMVKGDEIIIEVQGQINQILKSKLVVSSVNHDFVDFQSKMLSGSCNIDVVCSEEDGFGIIDNYRDIISSVGAYTLNGINQCSGMLINNTALDCKPYFITADHCDISQSNASSVVVYWNYENQTCRQPGSVQSGQPGNGFRTKFNSGSILRANSGASDFALIEMDDPIDPTLNLYFSGWDLSGELTDTSICIHHPNVEEKRISFDFDPMVYETGNAQTEYIRVLDWDLGTTEPGSSGAPIFNSRKQFIGQLNGGFAACGNNLYDVFGYINYSWDRNSSANRSLESWLDPLGLNNITLDGTFCGLNLELSQSEIDICTENTNEVTVDILPSPFFELNVNYEVINIPEGLSATFEKESGLGSEMNALSISGFDNVELGEYTVVISASDGSNVVYASIDFTLFNELPEVPQLKEPKNNAEDILSETRLQLERSSSLNNVFQVSTDLNFNQILLEKFTSSVFLEIKNLTPSTTYFWRSYSYNVCGESELSEVYTFKTASSFCTFISSSDGPKVIDPNTENTVSSSINFNYPVRVQDVDVYNISGVHSYIEDLAFKVSFNGSEVLLAETLCGNVDDFNFGFDDESENTQIDCPPVEGDIYKPKESLNLFDGMLAGGEWTLSVDDMLINDGGQLDEWTVKLCFNETEVPVIIPEFHEYNYCENQVLSVKCFYNSTGVDDFDVVVFDENSQNVLTDFVISPNQENQLSIEIGTQLLLGSSQNVQIALRNKSNLNVLAISAINLVKAGGEKSIVIKSPTNDEIIAFDGFDNITWEGDFEGETIVEISSNIQFTNIVYSQRVDEENFVDVSGLALLPGAYYVRLRNQFDCGEVPSEIVNFAIDESNSISEGFGLSLDLYPNPSNGLIYIKNTEEFEQNTVIRIFDITGRYYEPELHFVSSKLVVLDLSDQDDGLYVVKIQKDNTTLEKLVFKSR